MRTIHSTIFKNNFKESHGVIKLNGDALIISNSIILNILLLVLVGVISILVLNQI